MNAENAPDAAQMVPRMPKESSPGAGFFPARVSARNVFTVS
jgi:hypothetical protein